MDLHHQAQLSSFFIKDCAQHYKLQGPAKPEVGYDTHRKVTTNA